jgi:hypothetical protein
MKPKALDVAIQVEQKLRSRSDEVKRLFREHVERAEYEAALAKRRYMNVDPENRLVADELERAWNVKLRDLSTAQEEYETRCAQEDKKFNEKQKREIMALVKDFPRLWKDERIPYRERKRIVRLLIEDVTLLKTDKITAHVRFKGGKNHSFFLPLPMPCWLKHITPPEVIKEIDVLLDQYPVFKIADVLNGRGFKTGKGLSFHIYDVRYICRRYKLKSRRQRLIDAGFMTAEKMSKLLSVPSATVLNWRKQGLLKSGPQLDRTTTLFENPTADLLEQLKGKSTFHKAKTLKRLTKMRDEVQYEG